MKVWKCLHSIFLLGVLAVSLCMTNGALAAANPSAGVSAARETFVVKAVKDVGPAVVGITNKAYMLDNFYQKVLVQKGVGSGVIFDANGYIATNYHVVQGAQEIAVALNDGRTVKGKVVGVDPVTDLAVVKIEAGNLPVAEFGNSDEIMTGEPAIAIGNPLGLEFRGSVTVGVISALNRTIEVGDRRFKLIQTDAAINPGNSGGALVNADGKVIGINSAKISAEGVEGMGFAIPANSARPILDVLVKDGKITRAYLGISILDRSSAARYGYIWQIAEGIYVTRVVKDGPADQVGIQQGDILVKVNETEINSVADLRSVLDNVPVGSKVNITVLREGQKQTVSPTVTAMPN
ncbi:MAG: trypsin-like peptidase domain-containing protein [Pelosinus sp.]|nr:trypsin-like peptidase domain-containing protein [Pelosinus sp.]